MVVDIDEAQKDPKFRELVEKSIDHGAILSHLAFDTVGNTEELVKNTLVNFIGNLTTEQGVLYCKGEVHEVLKQEELFSGYAEVKILTKSFNDLVAVAIKYGPITVEIIKPSEVNLTLSEAQNIVLDASQAAQEFVNYIMQNIMVGEKGEEFKKILQAKSKMAEELQKKG